MQRNLLLSRKLVQKAVAERRYKKVINVDWIDGDILLLKILDVALELSMRGALAPTASA